MVDVAGIGVKNFQDRHEHLSKELEPLGESQYGDNKYVQLAAKIRKRRTQSTNRRFVRRVYFALRGLK